MPTSPHKTGSMYPRDDEGIVPCENFRERLSAEIENW